MSTTDPTPYTPTDEEWAKRLMERAWSDTTEFDDLPRVIAEAVAARDARVRAEALRDAAQAFNVEAVYFSSHDRSLSQGQQAAVVDVLAESLNWLHARAAYIEQETQS